jgi:hypothetical protein
MHTVKARHRRDTALATLGKLAALVAAGTLAFIVLAALGLFLGLSALWGVTAFLGGSL